MPTNGRFTLPALIPVSFSLTDGTDIPPPPDSPIQEATPAPPPAQETPKPAPINGSAAKQYDGRGRTTTTEPPLSPASTTRPSSIRRFLSRKSLNANYTNGGHDNGSSEDVLGGVGRPDSPSSFLSGKKSAGGWFSRKRTSVVYEAPVKQEVKKGPPPPKLPELSQLEAKVVDDEGGLGGGEMFRDIRGE